MRKYKLIAFTLLLFSSIAVASVANAATNSTNSTDSLLFAITNHANYDITLRGIQLKPLPNDAYPIRQNIEKGNSIAIMKSGSSDIVGYITNTGIPCGNNNDGLLITTLKTPSNTTKSACATKSDSLGNHQFGVTFYPDVITIDPLS